MKDNFNPFKTFEDDKKRYSKMSLSEAKELLGDRAKWELLNMKRALNMFPILNTSEENKRLVAVNKVLRSK